MMKAVIVMICCKEIYDLFVGIVSKFLDSILNVMPVQTVNLAESLSNNIAGGLFTAIACLVLLITWLILICQFIMKRSRDVINENGNTICINRSFEFG